jgi:nucleoside-diphosphate-sugar epimerase
LKRNINNKNGIMTKIDKTKPILVTGATGYVAGWLVKKLLEEGLTVHAAVRNPNNEEKIQHLNKIAKNSSGTIKYFKTDLLSQGSFAEAMDGCELVFHTASPFTTAVKDPQKDLVDPAVNGTTNVLEQANKSHSVKRVVLTSSVAAMYTDAVDTKNAPNGVITEDVWNTTASLKHQPYSYSKTLAEQKAWQISKKQTKWDLVVINPSFVMGPFLNPTATTSESFSVIKQMGDGTFKQGAPNMGVGIVDVRDVALAHFNAGFITAAKGRHITSGHNSSFLQIAQVLHNEFGKDYPIPNNAIPKWLLLLVGPIMNKTLTWKFIQNNVNHTFVTDNSKSKKELNVSYRPLKETMSDTFQVLIDNKII